MRLFDLPQAKHFCAPTSRLPAASEQSLPAFYASLRKGVRSMAEGTTYFEVHQLNLLNSVERWLLYALSDYRRAVDMFVPVSVPWAHVTLYYSAFFAANAILGMFGGWIGHTKTGNRLVDVERGTVGSLELRIHRKVSSPSGALGSHRIFWDIFYDSAAAISAWAPPDLTSALLAVNGDYAWQIAERNNVNYDMFHAWNASTLFHRTFKPSKLKTLSGPAGLQLESTERMIKLALHFAQEVALSRGSLQGCGPNGTRTQIQRRLVTQAPPSVVTQSALSDLLII